MNNWIETAYLDLAIYKLKRVGRRHLTAYELWYEWLWRD